MLIATIERILKMELNAVTKSVNEIFSVNKQYHVPRFQREYSWEKDELDEFWTDITLQIKSDNNSIINTEYFIGCIVLVGEDSKKDYLIVDGQQRLTTLTIFLRAIITRLIELNDKTAATALYENVIEGKDNDGKQYFKLVNETPKPYFQTEIQTLNIKKDNVVTTDEEKLLSDAYDFFNKQLKNYTINGLSQLEAVKKLRDQILNYLKFILVTAKNEDDAYTIFETLNARGISLTSVDLIKNWIFKNYSTTHPDDSAKTTWSKVRSDISEFADLETFFRHYWNSKYTSTSDERLYKSFNGCLKKGVITNAKSFLKEVEDAAKRYHKICAPQKSDWSSKKEQVVAKHLDRINQYKVTQVRPLLLALIEARGKKLIDETEFIAVVKNLDNFHFLFSNLCSSRASGLENIYTQTARKVYAAGTDKVKIRNELKILKSTLQSKLPSEQLISDAIKKLVFSKNNDVNKKTIQMVFIKIEEYLLKTKEFEIASLSLEHVSDESNNSNWVGFVGNLIPLDEKLNNEIKPNKSFVEKKRIYLKSQFKTVNLFITNNPQNTWGEFEANNWMDIVTKKTIEATVIN